MVSSKKYREEQVPDDLKTNMLKKPSKAETMP